MQDRQARRPRGGVRPAGARAHRPRRDERLGRAVQGLQEARRQADPGPRGVLRRRPHDPRGQDRAQPPDAARAGRRGLPEPHEAVERRLPARACTAASRASTWGCSSATARASSRSRAASPPAPAAGSSRAAWRTPARTSTTSSRLRPGERLLRDPAQRDRRAGAGQRGDRDVRAGDGPPARRDRRRALPAPRGLPPPRRAAVRADEVDAGAAEDVLRHQRVLPQELGGDGAVVRRPPGGARVDGGDRRALRRVDRAGRPAHPELRDAERRVRGRAPARRWSPTGCACATATPSRRRRASAPTWSWA